MSVAFVSPSPEQTEDFGVALGLMLRPENVVLLTGDLGAGKTQFTKGIARGLGIEQDVTSPTFNLVLEYESATGKRLRHFDLYRLERAAELGDIDYFGLLEDDAISVVEWGDKFSQALPLDYLLISFEVCDSGATGTDGTVGAGSGTEQTRVLRCEAVGPRSTRLLADFGEKFHG
ncbi:MAG: tRNA (adenosine(37)-N6)-threonylcarbamoyltransferase complex ATPase subunit type 1 TsaE [Coriobacteriales bacterium]|jgi:tRNA threonylcarbamoyladenosine biosynthesis protein TsaE|nr:tRNA (adenosine(37)-N6)-threonylcarbamoyltransferase complex ATPase subunit type 1 TsaE [Coriobacteriales bacterium]